MPLDNITAVFNSLKVATELAMYLNTSGIKLKRAENQSKTADLLILHAEIKEKLADVKEELLLRDEEIKKLKMQKAVKQDLIWDEYYYWLKTKEGKQGPFCQCCQDKDANLIRLQNLENGVWQCRVCEKIFTDSRYVSRNVKRVKDDYDPFLYD